MSSLLGETFTVKLQWCLLRLQSQLNMVFHGDGNSGSFQEGTTDNYFYREISKIVLKAYIDPGKMKN